MPSQFSITWLPLLPTWSIALITVTLLALVAWGAAVLVRKKIPQRWVVRLGLVRVVAVLLFAACLMQPTISYLRSRTQHPELVVLIDASQSMQQSDAGDGRSRLASAVETLRSSKLLETLGQDFQLKFFAFDRRAYPLDESDLDTLKAKSDTTDFATSLNSIADLAAAESDDASSSTAPRHVLLVSDGQDHGSENFAEAAARAGAMVDVLPAGTEQQGHSTAPTVARVQAPPRVLLASETQFLVTTERGDDAPQTYVLTLYEDGDEVLTQDVAFAAGVREQRTTVAYRPTEAGLKRYEFALTPKKADPKAAVSNEDRYSVNVQVVDEHIEVLVLEDRWRWDFKFFKRVLEDDPSFSLTAMLARGGGQFMQMGEPDRNVNLGSFPQSRAELAWFDILVLGDAQPTRWPSGLSGAIADAVIEDGKSLIVVAGPSLGELAQVPELHMLLPVELSIDSASPIEGPLDIQLTPEGAESGLFADGDQGTVALPPIDRIYAPLRKRPAATVLVEATGEANSAGRLIVLAEQSVGRGRVLYVATDALWKWQTLTSPDNEGRTVYAKFWQQALRALTPSRTAAAPLWLTADRSRYTSGDRVTLRAEVPALADREKLKLDGAIVLPDERRLPLVFEPDPTVVDGYVAEFDAVAAGRYRIDLTANVDGQTAAETSIAVEASAARGESDDTGVDRAALAEIAARTGGKVLDPADPQTWPQANPGPAPQIEERKTVNLWDNLSMLTLLCLILGGDWLMRMLRGYV